MGKPRLCLNKPCYGVIIEITSAISALNMVPSPIADPKGDYLSDKDEWAAHSIEQMSAAQDYAIETQVLIDSLINAVANTCPEVKYCENQREYVKALIAALGKKK